MSRLVSVDPEPTRFLSSFLSSARQRDVKDYGGTRAQKVGGVERGFGRKYKGISGAKRPERNEKKEGKWGKPAPPVEPAGERRIDKPVVSFQPHDANPTSDYTGCVSTACTWPPARARTGPKLVACMCAVYTRAGYYAMRYILHPCSPSLYCYFYLPTACRVVFTCDFSYITTRNTVHASDADREILYKCTQVCVA